MEKSMNQTWVCNQGLRAEALHDPSALYYVHGPLSITPMNIPITLLNMLRWWPLGLLPQFFHLLFANEATILFSL